MAFRGHFDYSLDAKKRLNVPPKFRASFSGGVVLAKALEPCVAIWTPDGFEQWTESFLSRLGPLSPERRKLTRFFAGSSFDAELDSAGRVRIPKHLVEHAGLEGACVVIGMADHFEVWNAHRWEEQEAESSARVSEAAAELAQRG